MTEDKLFGYWTVELNRQVYYTAPNATKFNADELKIIEDYIRDAKPIPANFKFSRCLSIYGFPKDLVKEMKGGDNPEMAKRILYIISKKSYYGVMCGYSSKSEIEICKAIGYSFAEIANEMQWERIGYYQHEAYAPAFAEIYKDEVLEYVNDKLLAEIAPKTVSTVSKNVNDTKLIVFLATLTEIVVKDYENHKDTLKLILKYMDKLVDGVKWEMLAKVYNLSCEAKAVFDDAVTKNTHYYASLNTIFLNYYGKGRFKEELYKLGLQKKYYYWALRRSAGNYWYAKNAYMPELESLYNENRDMFAETCYEMITKKPVADMAVYVAAFMYSKNDGQREIDALAEAVPHYIHMLVDEFNNCASKNKGEEVINFVNFMKMMNSDEPSKENIELLRLNSWSKCGGIDGEIGMLAVLYKFFEPARKCIRLLMMSAYDLSSNLKYLGDFYTVFVDARKTWLKISEKESIETLREFLPLDAFFKIYCYANSTKWDAHYMDIDKEAVIALANENPAEARNFFDIITASENTVTWLDIYYNLECEKDFKPLIDGLKAKTKLLRKKAFEIAENYEPEIRDELEKMLPKLKGDANINVDKLIRKWDNVRKFGKDFSFSSNEFTAEFCKENLNPSAVKKISWIDESCFEGIRYADLSGTASPDIFKYILSEYMLLDEPARLMTCDKAAERLNSTDLQDALENIYKNWIEEGSDTKKKFITLPYCIYASDSQIIRMKKQIETWAGASRGQLAAFVVKNMALNSGNIALLTVDTISKKFKNNMVKSAAADAIAEAAEILEVSVDELTDKIIPKLDFDKNGERIFDYGERTFTVSLMPDFSLTIHDNQKDKDVKSMPKPNDKDDAVKAEAAKKEFSELKKQIKAVVSSQKQRLEKVLMNGRMWKTDKWRELFEENAVMHCFAENLIWGIYDGDTLKSTFRYLSDGSFCNEDDDEFELPENADITLIHPIELDDELKAKWAEQLEDYEIVQPFNQLFASVIKLDEKEVLSDEGAVTKYDGRDSVSGRMSGVSNKYSMDRGSAGDGGSFEGYIFTDDYLGVSMHINADMLYFGQGFDEPVKIEEIKFTKDNMPVDPLTLKKRFISGCMNIVESMLEA